MGLSALGLRGSDKQLPFADHSLYTAAKNTPGAIKRAIDAAIIGTSVTVVVNGQATWSSDWVRYEIAESFEKGNGFIVVDIAGVGPRPDMTPGPNPLAFIGGVADDMTETTRIKVYESDGRDGLRSACFPTSLMMRRSIRLRGSPVIIIFNSVFHVVSHGNRCLVPSIQ